MLTRLSLVLLTIGLAAVSGCSKAPETELREARSALDNARLAEAEEYAPEAYQAALDSLNSAIAMKSEQDSKFALFRRYDDSRMLLTRSKELGANVALEAAAEKERIHDELMSRMDEIRANIEATSLALQNAPKGKGSRADLEMMSSDLSTANDHFAAIQADITAGKYKTALAKIEAVGSSVERVMNAVNTASMKATGK